MSARPVDPRLRVLYLAGVALAAFLVRDGRVVASFVVAQAIAWLALGLGTRAIVRQIVKLWGLAAFVIVSYALTSDDPSVDRWVHVDLGITRVALNAGGAVVGATMVLRVLAVVFASRIARAGDERAIALGLRKLGSPDVVASSIDAVLALLGGHGGRGRGGGGGGGRGGGRGRGGGGGGGRGGDEPAPQEGFFASLRRIARGDVQPIVDRIERHIDRAEQYLDRSRDGDRTSDHGENGRRRIGARHASRDIAVIVGLSLTMLGIKALKLLPNIPFAPGHKLVILTPLYIVASRKTHSKAGATLTGLVMGSVAFLLGDGRYGVFEILKHVVPGILCDLLVPIVMGASSASGRRPGAVAWSFVGGVMGLGRFATIFTVTFAVQAPAVAWAFLLPGLVIHTSFGVLSGLVSSPLIRAVLDRDALAAAPPPETTAPTKNDWKAEIP